MQEDKYKNDRYDRTLYIPKGYILPDGSQLTKAYARFHEDMAKKFIEENYYNSYINDFIKDLLCKEMVVTIVEPKGR